MDALDPAQLERLLTLEMPYGKYQGRLIADLPGNYLNWFAREGFPGGELGRLLALCRLSTTTACASCCARCVPDAAGPDEGPCSARCCHSGFLGI